MAKINDIAYDFGSGGDRCLELLDVNVPVSRFGPGIWSVGSERHPNDFGLGQACPVGVGVEERLNANHLILKRDGGGGGECRPTKAKCRFLKIGRRGVVKSSLNANHLDCGVGERFCRTRCQASQFA